MFEESQVKAGEVYGYEYRQDASVGQLKISDDNQCTNHVMQQYGQLEKSLAVMGETIDKLRQKLDPVLGPEASTPTGAADGRSPVQTRSPLAEQLRSDTHRVMFFNSSLVDILHRLEL